MLLDGKLLRFKFFMRLPPSPSKELQLGVLSYSHSNKELYRWVVTSGIPGWQYSGSTKHKGRGPLPSCQYAQIPFYEIQPKKIFMPRTKGIEGSFYPILPFAVNLRGENYQRSDFGVHFDANVPGSSGCLAFRKQSDWDAFRFLMAQLEIQKIDRVRLDVSYS